MSTPPFAPPYKSRIVADTAEGAERWVDVAADGTRTDTAAPAPILEAIKAHQLQAPVERKGKPGVTLLTVPYAEKDEAKGLGAKWDATRRKWYVPAGVDVAAFSRWVKA